MSKIEMAWGCQVFNGDGLELDGQTIKHGAANSLANLLRDAGGK